MAWTMEKYPVALKNFGKLMRKKIIEIGNTLIADGYTEARAIPIAISQAREWMDNASQEELKAFKAALLADEKLLKADKKSVIPTALDNELVFQDGVEWVVRAEDTEKLAGRFASKEAAVKRAQEIAVHRTGHVLIKKQQS